MSATILFECMGEGTTDVVLENPMIGEASVKLADSQAQPISILPENIIGTTITQSPPEIHIAELITFILVTIGLLTLGGFLLFRKRLVSV